ncbi:unnamed protein product [Allacma fusca]|uniref:DUF427 domain-containing protein n=1 Tax=Allacma fusca TaxID=39272 RepID=A0A8J2LR92_9HEXA|nr:unnamed protein product [Allacma fusca]
MVQAVWNRTVIAEAPQRHLLFVDNRYYFPFSAVYSQYIADSRTRKNCPWKGVEFFFDVVVNGRYNNDAAWTYYNPMRGYEFMVGYIVFNETVQLYF